MSIKTQLEQSSWSNRIRRIVSENLSSHWPMFDVNAKVTGCNGCLWKPHRSNGQWILREELTRQHRVHVLEEIERALT